jgi:hypothetical protein
MPAVANRPKLDFLSSLGCRRLRIEQQGKELTTHLVPARNDGNAREQWFICIGHHAVAKDVYDRGASRCRCVVCVRPVHRSSVMERAFALPQLHGNRLEFVLQFFGKMVANAIHFSGQDWLGQVGPFVAPRNVVQATIFSRGIVKTNPASEMGQGRGPCPVRIVLVPGHHPAMSCRFAEKLVMPEAHWAAQ